MNITAKLKIAKSNGGGQAFKIEHNVPIPERRYKKKPNPFHDTFAKMRVESRFKIEDDDVGRKARYHAAKWGKENNAAFVFRATDDGEYCWRVK